MTTIGDGAVVMGASMAGLLAARTLSEVYERVTVIERDALPCTADHRRGVPQGRHVHALLPRGKELIEELFPGLTDELVTAGAAICDLFGEARFAPAGTFLAHRSTGLHALQATRPMLEHHVRERVAALPNVRLLDRCDVVGLIAQDDRITGVRLIPRSDNGAEQDLVADLVVDTTGRSGRTPAWLEALGHTPPLDEHIRIGVGYASCLLRLDPAALNGDKLIAIGPHRGQPWGMAMMAVEDGWSLLTVLGYRGHHPPPDLGGVMSFVARSAPPDVYEAVAAAQPIDDRVATYRLESNLRRHYERLRRFPDGLVVLGDAVTSFNPIYGQGMTVAALQAVALRHCVSQADRFTSRRFLRTSARLATTAWDMTTGADLDLPEVEGPRPVKVRIINAYMRRLVAAASHDTVLATAFMRVAGMVDQPPTLLRPRNVVRVLRGQHTARLEFPRITDGVGVR